ncbi:MAG: DNA-binding protein WhiA [Clostridia bacterium]|nr:DNA-binding protein WhiA [Clostridia bacterium]
MSFTKKVKDEMARIDDGEKCCQLAELKSLIMMAGNVHIDADYHLSLTLETENPAIARRAYRLAKNLFNLQHEVSVKRRARLKKSTLYVVRLLPQIGTKKAFKTLGIELTPKGYELKWDSDIFRKRCCHRSYLRGVFLGSGSVSNPEQKTYHLEIIVKDPTHYKIICELMRNFGLNPKSFMKRKNYMIYLKESEQIVDFLNIIGAHAALLSFEGTRVKKEVRNRVNRLVNCETANLNKTVDAAIKQVEAIRLLERNLGLDKLPAGLEKIACLRLENPDLSLKELGELMNPVISKSGVNHRMRRLQKMADKISGKKFPGIF